MLHHHLGGVPDRAGRTVYHSRAFREAEARYPWHRQALAWEKENLPRLLRASHGCRRAARAGRRRRPGPRPAGARRLGSAAAAQPCFPCGASSPTCAATAGRSLVGLRCLLLHHRPLGGLALGAALRHRRPHARRSRARSSSLYAGLMVGLVMVEGVFRYFMRMVLIGLSREIEYELRDDLFAHLTRLPARYYHTHAHRRPDEPRHQRPVGGAHGAGPRHHVHGQHAAPRFVGAVALMARISPCLAAARAAAAGVRFGAGALLRPPDPRPLRGRAGPALAASRALRAGEPGRRARGARLRAGGAGGGTLRAGQPASTSSATAASSACSAAFIPASSS